MDWMHDKEIKNKQNPASLSAYFNMGRGWLSGVNSKLLSLKISVKWVQSHHKYIANGQFKNGICATGNQSKEHNHLKDVI